MISVQYTFMSINTICGTVSINKANILTEQAAFHCFLSVCFWQSISSCSKSEEFSESISAGYITPVDIFMTKSPNHSFNQFGFIQREKERTLPFCLEVYCTVEKELAQLCLTCHSILTSCLLNCSYQATDLPVDI